MENGTSPRVTLAGNPNCGKTTLFNALTGLKYKVANYPGVTVERKAGSVDIPDFGRIVLVDLPGVYSLSGQGIDERIAVASLLGRDEGESTPDCIVVVVDASNLERNLYLVTQLIDLGLPLILALNMGDVAEAKGISIHKEILARELDLPVVSILARVREGLDPLVLEIGKLLSAPRHSAKGFAWCVGVPFFKSASVEIGKKYERRDLLREDSRSAMLSGVALLCGDLPVPVELESEVSQARKTLEGFGINPQSFEAAARYAWIHRLVQKCRVKEDVEKRLWSERIDGVLSHRFFGSLIFIAIMATIFQSIFTWAQVPMEFIDSLVGDLGKQVKDFFPEGLLRSLLVDGVVTGVGNVLIFIPQIALLFFFLGLLEDCGYLSRAAFLMDRVMRPFGLQGRSFIPLLSSFACAIPGILSTRTIPSRTDRLATILVAPLMSCSARLPVFAVLIAAFVPEKTVLGAFSLQGLTLLGMYLLGIFGAAFVAWLLKLSLLRGTPALFVMEMPPLRAPSLVTVLREDYDRVLAFLRSAGTVILACTIILWFLASFPRPPAGLERGRVEHSYAGQIGKLIEPALEPFDLNWEVGVSVLASFAAREVFVSSLATVYNLDNSTDPERSLIETLKEKRMSGRFSSLSAIALMVFYVFACQCMSTLAVCKRETGSWVWTGFMFLYMSVLAYGAALLTFQVGSYFL